MRDEWKGFTAIGRDFPTHDTVCHSKHKYARGAVHANSAETFNSRLRRTVAGVFQHISSDHADLYFNEIGFRWSQIAPAIQLKTVLRRAVGRQMRRFKDGGLTIISRLAVFG